MKRYILFDHDGVLVETEQWYYLANKRALASLGYERAKPHPEPYLRGLERFGATAAETVVIEDSARGLKSAIAAGIDCIVVANEFTAAHDLSRATAKVATFRELPSTIEGLTS